MIQKIHNSKSPFLFNFSFEVRDRDVKLISIPLQNTLKFLDFLITLKNTFL